MASSLPGTTGTDRKWKIVDILPDGIVPRDLLVERTKRGFKLTNDTVQLCGIGHSKYGKSQEILMIENGTRGLYILFQLHQNPHCMENRSMRNVVRQVAELRSIPLRFIPQTERVVEPGVLVFLPQTDEIFISEVLPHLEELFDDSIITQAWELDVGRRGTRSINVNYAAQNQKKVASRTVTAPQPNKHASDPDKVMKLVILTTVVEGVVGKIRHLFPEDCVLPFHHENTARLRDFAMDLIRHSGLPAELHGKALRNIFEGVTVGLTTLGDGQNMLTSHLDTLNAHEQGLNGVVGTWCTFQHTDTGQFVRVVINGYNRNAVSGVMIRENAYHLFVERSLLYQVIADDRRLLPMMEGLRNEVRSGRKVQGVATFLKPCLDKNIVHMSSIVTTVLAILENNPERATVQMATELLVPLGYGFNHLSLTVLYQEWGVRLPSNEECPNGCLTLLAYKELVARNGAVTSGEGPRTQPWHNRSLTEGDVFYCIQSYHNEIQRFLVLSPVELADRVFMEMLVNEAIKRLLSIRYHSHFGIEQVLRAVALAGLISPEVGLIQNCAPNTDACKSVKKNYGMTVPNCNAAFQEIKRRGEPAFVATDNTQLVVQVDPEQSNCEMVRDFFSDEAITTANYQLVVERRGCYRPDVHVDGQRYFTIAREYTGSAKQFASKQSAPELLGKAVVVELFPMDVGSRKAVVVSALGLRDDNCCYWRTNPVLAVESLVEVKPSKNSTFPGTKLPKIMKKLTDYVHTGIGMRNNHDQWVAGRKSNKKKEYDKKYKKATQGCVFRQDEMYSDGAANNWRRQKRSIGRDKRVDYSDSEEEEERIRVEAMLELEWECEYSDSDEEEDVFEGVVNRQVDTVMCHGRSLRTTKNRKYTLYGRYFEAIRDNGTHRSIDLVSTAASILRLSDKSRMPKFSKTGKVAKGIKSHRVDVGTSTEPKYLFSVRFELPGYSSADLEDGLLVFQRGLNRKINGIPFYNTYEEARLALLIYILVVKGMEKSRGTSIDPFWATVKLPPYRVKDEKTDYRVLSYRPFGSGVDCLFCILTRLGGNGRLAVCIPGAGEDITSLSAFVRYSFCDYDTGIILGASTLGSTPTTLGETNSLMGISIGVSVPVPFNFYVNTGTIVGCDRDVEGHAGHRMWLVEWEDGDCQHYTTAEIESFLLDSQYAEKQEEVIP